MSLTIDQFNRMFGKDVIIMTSNESGRSFGIKCQTEGCNTIVLSIPDDNSLGANQFQTFYKLQRLISPDNIDKSALLCPLHIKGGIMKKLKQ